MISIAVPSWNSLKYLKILYHSLKKNTKLKYELIVHNNGSEDGTAEWLAAHPDIVFTHSETNEGFCGVNHALKLATHPYVMIFNSDMYVLPFWDTEIFKQINDFRKQGVEKFTISPCLIEPFGNNPEYTIRYHGHDAESFNEERLVTKYMEDRKKLSKVKNTIQWSHPILIPRFMMKEIDYLDESYFPGWNIDNDLPRCLNERGCKKFIMLPASRVYHFVSKTFTKLPIEIQKMDGQKRFFEKWGETTEDFRQRMKVKKTFDDG